MKDALVYYFRNAAGFRESLIPKDEPWNPKNQKYAVRLNAIADYVESLPDDDSTLQLLAGCQALFDEEAGFTIPDDEWQAVIHCGGDDPAAWFADWGAALADRPPERSCDECENEITQ